MKVLVNSEYVDLSLVRSISTLKKEQLLRIDGNTIVFLYMKSKYSIVGMAQIELIKSFTITYLNASKYTVEIDSPIIDLAAATKAIDNGEDYVAAFKEYWETLRSQIEVRDKEIEEKYNKLLELWNKSVPSDIPKIIF